MRRFVIIDIRASNKILKNIEKHGFDVVFSKPYSGVSLSCASHPDISLFRLGNNKIIYAPGTDEKMLQKLSDYGVILIEGKTKPGSVYPDEVKYNASVIGKYLFHRIDVTDEKILSEAGQAGIEPVNVRQGYTGCSVSLVRKNIIMTSDVGIHKEAVKRGIESLLLPPQKRIKLAGAQWGFIGGATGRMDDSRLAIAGDAQKLDSFKNIQSFLNSKEVEIVSLSDDEVTDLGTMMFFTL